MICTEHNDPTYAVSGLVYDVDGEESLASCCRRNLFDTSALVTLTALPRAELGGGGRDALSAQRAVEPI